MSAQKRINNNNLDIQNNISIKIKGNGYQYIFNSDKFPPDLVYLNGELTTLDAYNGINIETEEEENIVRLIWNNKVTSCENFFSLLTNIIEVDLSEFDFSEVTSMNGMFSSCINLEYINFDNINTSSLIDMSFMFQDCESLEEIDLSFFNTSKVLNMEALFFQCLSLYSIDLSYLNTSQVTNMQFTFFGFEFLEEIDISHFDTSMVTNMNFLFSYCYSLTSVNLNCLNTSKVLTMVGLFEGCISLKSIDLSKIDTSSVINMGSMFYECSSLISLDLSNINTSNVEDMNYMFALSSSLKSINLKGFDIYNVYDMTAIFYSCLSLESLDLTSFIFNQAKINSMFEDCNSLTSIQFSKKYKLVDYAYSMFRGCSSLLSIDLFNFDFELIDNLDYLFYGCSSLTSLDLSSIDTFSVEKMDFTFYGCNSLETLNFENWITSSVTSIKSLFYDCVSLKSLDLSNFDTYFVNDMKELFYNCVKLTSINLENFETSLVTNMESMFYGCISLTSLNLSSFDTSKVSIMKSMFFRCTKLTSLDLSSFKTDNAINMVSMFSGCTNLGYINFYNYNYNDDSLYIDDIFYKISDNLVLCINLNNKTTQKKIISELSTLTCPILDCSNNWKENKKRINYNSGECIDDCKEDKLNKYEFEYFCYKECPKGSHSSKNNKYFCENNSDECLKKSPFYNVDNKSCLEKCNSEDFFNGKCGLNVLNTDNIKNLISNIIDEIEKGMMDKLITKIINDKKDLIIKINETIFQMTSSFNQNYNIYQNISSIKLGECENILKENYGILKNESLYIFKIEQREIGFLIPLIEYIIFYPKTKEKFNLNFCKNSNINIYIPIAINENILYKYNPNNIYYNDICNTTTSEYGTDITLYDRKNEYNMNNYFLCPINCEYSNYNSDNKSINCQCKSENEITLNNKKLLNYLKTIKRKQNLEVMRCFRLLFSKKGLIKNISNYIIFLIIILHVILGIYFYIKGFKLLCSQINELINLKRIENEYKSKIAKNNGNRIRENSYETISSKKNTSLCKNNNNYQLNLKLKLSSELNNTNAILSNNKDKLNKMIENQKTIEYEEYEINNISYQNAIENDKRNFCQIYISLLKVNHIVIFTFNSKKDYNPYSIKICIFFFIFSLFMFINCLFFNDNTMHKIYQDK